MLHGQIWIKIWKMFKYFSRKIFLCRLLTTKFQIFLAWKWIVVLHTLPKAGGKQLVFACTLKTSRKTRFLSEFVLETQQGTFWWSILGTKIPYCCLNKIHMPAHFKEIHVRCVYWLMLRTVALLVCAGDGVTAHVRPKELQFMESGLQLSKEKEEMCYPVGPSESP